MVIGKDLIANDGDVSCRAHRRDPAQLVFADERAGRVVWRDDEERTRARTRGALDAVDVDRPGAVILKVVVAGGEQIEPGQVLEQRIARTRHQDFVAVIGEQLEQQ